MRYKLMATTMSLAVLTALDVRAETAAVGGPVAAGAGSGAQLGEIIVTAERREQGLQEVTGTVDAFRGEDLENLNVRNINDIQVLTPGLLVARVAASTNIYLRGVGTVSAGDSEPSVATYIDGFYIPNSNATFFSFNNIERVEVLKGPQGTLYGRNTSGGLVHVITRDPGSEPRLDLSAGYGNYNTSRFDLYGSTPLTHDLAANVSVTHTDQQDGWGKNLFTGHDNRKFKETGVQSKGVWTPTDTTRVTLRGMYDEVDSDQGNIAGTFPGAVAQDGSRSLGENVDSMRRDPRTLSTIANGGIKLEQDLGFAKFQSLTGYFHSRTNAQFEFQGIPGNPVLGQGAIEQNFHFRSNTLSQELDLSSNSSAAARLEWITGFFYYDDDIKEDIGTFGTCVGTVCSPVPPPIRTVAHATTKSYAGFGESTYRFLAHTKVTLGLRYTSDDKGLSGLNSPLAGRPNTLPALPPVVTLYPGAPFPGNPNGIPTSVTFSKLTYKAVLAQDFTDLIHGYVSYNRGFKAGGYATTNFANVPSRPEIVDAYEVGVKSELLDRMLRLNLAGFYYDYKDIQVRTSAPPAPPGNAITYNAAAAEIKGVDAEFVLVPSRSLAINGSLEYLESTYRKFPGATCTSPAPIGGRVLGGNISFPCDLSGQRLVDSPPWSISLGATYTLDTSVGVFALAANDAYKSLYSLEATSRLKQNAYHLLSSSLTWTAPKGQIEIQLWGKNLTNTYYYAAAAASQSDAYVAGTPRTYGAQIGVHF